MEFTLVLNKRLMTTYAKLFGYCEDELECINKDEVFKEILINTLEETCKKDML